MVIVSDSHAVSSTVSTSVTVKLSDVNETPLLTSNDLFAIAENSLGGAQVGILTASDQDAGQALKFSLMGEDESLFEVDSITGKLAVKSSAILDYEARSEYSLTVNVTDSGAPSLSASMAISVTLIDINEPPLVKHAISKQVAAIWSPFSFVIPPETFYDSDANDVLRLSIRTPDGAAVPHWISFDASSLRLTGTPDSIDVGDVLIEVIAEDLLGEMAITSLLIQVYRPDSPWNNQSNSFDTNANGIVAPIDAIVVINYLNRYGVGIVPPDNKPSFGLLDTNRDNKITPIDALVVINFLNRRNGEAEGSDYFIVPDLNELNSYGELQLIKSLDRRNLRRLSRF